MFHDSDCSSRALAIFDAKHGRPGAGKGVNWCGNVPQRSYEHLRTFGERSRTMGGPSNDKVCHALDGSNHVFSTVMLSVRGLTLTKLQLVRENSLKVVRASEYLWATFPRHGEAHQCIERRENCIIRCFTLPESHAENHAEKAGTTRIKRQLVRKLYLKLRASSSDLWGTFLCRGGSTVLNSRALKQKTRKFALFKRPKFTQRRQPGVNARVQNVSTLHWYKQEACGGCLARWRGHS